MKRKLFVMLAICLAITTLFCSCMGEQGEQGPQGIQGPKGDQGPKGEPGAAGVNGINGQDGKNGEDGKTPEFRSHEGWVQWKYTDEADTEWRNLYEYYLTVTDPCDPIPDGVPSAYVSTTSSTDQYGLAGTYTMLSEKEVAVGDTVSLTATINEGYNFEGWYINEVLLSDQLVCTYTVTNNDVEIEAVYSAYTITTTATNNTGGAAGTYTNFYNKKLSEGEKVNLVATVNEGYNFEGWYVNNICVSRALNYEYTMEKKNIAFEARFSSYHLTTLGVAVNSNGKAEAGFNAGTYTKYSNEKLSTGESVTLTATVKDGYNFVGWYIDEICVSNNFEYAFTMEKEDITVMAVYSYYTVTTTARYGNTSEPSSTSNWEYTSPAAYISPVYSAQKFSVGSSITLTATADIGSRVFYGWMTGDFALLSQETEYTFTMVESDITIFALYLPK